MHCPPADSGSSVSQPWTELCQHLGLISLVLDGDVAILANWVDWQLCPVQRSASSLDCPNVNTMTFKTQTSIPSAVHRWRVKSSQVCIDQTRAD